MERITNLGRFIAYILRHNPNAAQIHLDKNGWADVDELIDGANRVGKLMDKKDLCEIVETDPKHRFSFNGDASKIRANQGHSIDVDLDLIDLSPPDILYHGTATKFIDDIKRDGLDKRKRNYVHLSPDEQTAARVGARHGEPIVLKIDASAMYKDGCKFYLSVNGVWLTDCVPVKYVFF